MTYSLKERKLFFFFWIYKRTVKIWKDFIRSNKPKDQFYLSIQKKSVKVLKDYCFETQMITKLPL